jgi:hypothetical protein
MWSNTDMKNRIGILWLAALTVYISYTTTDTYNVLRDVASNQHSTLLYMEKSAEVLRQLKQSRTERR